MANELDEEEVVEEEDLEVEAEESETEDTTDWKAEAEALKGRLKRAETKLSKSADKPAAKPTSKSDGLDYGAKAYLAANGIKGAKEFDFVQSELKKSGEELDALLENDYFKTRLDNFRALSKTAEAVPKGNRSSAMAVDSVDYWMAKPFEEVPKDMKAKVVQAKLDKEKSKGVFYNS